MQNSASGVRVSVNGNFAVYPSEFFGLQTAYIVRSSFCAAGRGLRRGQCRGIHARAAADVNSCEQLFRFF
jgi:hypothetical protein